MLRDLSFHSALEAEENEAEQHRTAASSKAETDNKRTERRQARASKTPEEIRAAEVTDAEIRATQHAAAAALITETANAANRDDGPSLISTAAEIRLKEKQIKLRMKPK